MFMTKFSVLEYVVAALFAIGLLAKASAVVASIRRKQKPVYLRARKAQDQRRR
jgi:hypothetical protein